MPDFPADVEYAEHGHGPAILLLPGSFGTGSGWRSVTSGFTRDYRIVTTSLLGYGETAERRTQGNSSLRQQTEIIDLILRRIGEPTHVVGHSFGGLVALAHAIAGTRKPASLTLVEANPLGLLRTMGEASFYAMFEAMTQDYFAAFAAGKLDAARRVIDFYGGDGTFVALPDKVRDYVIKTTPANILDRSSGIPFEPPLSAYRDIAVPTLVISGDKGHPAMRRIAELLVATIPPSRLETVADGSHFLPATHPGELARLIEVNIQAAAHTTDRLLPN